jgi:uncharacterized protein (TIGR02118 family)
VIKRISLLRRKDGMTPEAFWQHYAGPHATIVLKLPGVQRMILARVVGPQSATWDAVGELWFEDAAALAQAFADPEIAELLAQDRSLFLGQSELIIAEETVFWPAENAQTS